MEEDLLMVVECSFSRIGDDGVENCVLKENCPTEYPAVFYISHFSLPIYIHFLFFRVDILEKELEVLIGSAAIHVPRILRRRLAPPGVNG
jgi:hypothetical protein